MCSALIEKKICHQVFNTVLLATNANVDVCRRETSSDTHGTNSVNTTHTRESRVKVWVDVGIRRWSENVGLKIR